jgi:putative membrane protein
MTGFGMMSGMIIFWIITIVLAVLLVHGLFQQNNQSTDKRSFDSKPTAQQILEERYARGEINQEQFRLMQQDIK